MPDQRQTEGLEIRGRAEICMQETLLSPFLTRHRLQQVHVSFVLNYNITYLVSSRRSIEIWRVCKIYGRRGGAEPSIYFTNLTYFYVRSGTDQISVLFLFT